MPIKASAARQIEQLIADLSVDRAPVREAAIARLALLGARAVDALLIQLESTDSARVRTGVLHALEAIGDPRALDRVLVQIDAPDQAVASAAVSAARAYLSGKRGTVVVDRLTRTVLDRSCAEPVRIAALRALGDLKRSTLAPLLATLTHDPSDALRAAMQFDKVPRPIDVVTDAAERGLPDEPDELTEALAHAGARVTLPLLLKIIERVRERERAEPEARRQKWTRLRGRAHVALAKRGSRVALYDLRESLETAVSPLPVEFLAAVHAIGEASCLEATAAAYARAPRGAGDSGEDWWRDRLADAFRTIAARERLTRRHTVMRKLAKRWGAATLDQLWSVGLREPGLGLGRSVASDTRARRNSA
jgi:HEAT repeat protein